MNGEILWLIIPRIPEWRLRFWRGLFTVLRAIGVPRRTTLAFLFRADLLALRAAHRWLVKRGLPAPSETGRFSTVYKLDGRYELVHWLDKPGEWTLHDTNHGLACIVPRLPASILRDVPAFTRPYNAVSRILLANYAVTEL